MLDKVQHPHFPSNITAHDLENFFYALDTKVYEPLFLYAATLNRPPSLFAKIPLSNHCARNCSFCAYRHDNPSQRFILDQNALSSLIKNSQEAHMHGVIFESGVFHPELYECFLQCSSIFEGLSWPVFFDIGLETLLAFSLPSWVRHVFLDYSPRNPELLGFLNIGHRYESFCAVFDRKNYAVYCNFVVDAPGQEFGDVVGDLLALWSNPLVKGIKVCPFVPGGSLFGRFEKACFLTTLKVIALSRIYRRDWEIFVEPSISLLDHEDAMAKALRWGANASVTLVGLPES